MHPNWFSLPHALTGFPYQVKEGSNDVFLRGKGHRFYHKILQLEPKDSQAPTKGYIWRGNKSRQRVEWVWNILDIEWMGLRRAISWAIMPVNTRRDYRNPPNLASLGSPSDHIFFWAFLEANLPLDVFFSIMLRETKQNKTKFMRREAGEGGKHGPLL